MKDRFIGRHFFLSESLAELTPLERLFFVGLWCVADREGRLRDQPKRLKAEILPYDDLDSDAVLAHLEETGTILRYTADHQGYIQIVRFQDFQRPHHRESPSLIPPPPDHRPSKRRASASTEIVRRIQASSKDHPSSEHGASKLYADVPPSDSPLPDPVPDPESPPTPPSRAVFVPPTVEEVRDYCEERGNGVDPEEFWAFYESKGWMVGSNKMKNWKAAVVTWERNRANGTAPGRGGASPSVLSQNRAGASDSTFIPWDPLEVREFGNAKEWGSYFEEMEAQYGLDRKWPRYKLWLKAKEGGPIGA